jgi:drug/metabolite transporter (DMT)-like permease
MTNMTSMKNTLKFILLSVLSLIWGLNWVAIKISLEGFPPFTSAALRFLVGGLALLVYVRWKRIPLRLNRYEFWLVLLTAFLMYVVDYGLIFWGEQYLSAGVTSIFFSTYALFTALSSNFLFRNEPFRLKYYVGMFTGLVGIVLVFYDQLVITKFSTLVTLASVSILIAALAASGASVIIKKHLEYMDPVRLTFYQVLMGAIFLLILAFSIEKPFQSTPTTESVIAMIYMGIAASAVAFVLYYKLLREMSVIALSFIIYIIPLVALFGDFIIYGEVLPLRSFIGMVIIFSGIGLSRVKKKAKIISGND